MADFLKEAVQTLHDILMPVAKRFGDPEEKKQFQQSIGYQGKDSDAPPSFPDGSAMENYLKNEEESKDEILFAQSLAEVAQMIDALRGIYETGADTYYAINPDESATRAERVEMAISELVTLTINIFALDYVRLRHPLLHNVFIISGIVDEMGQRAGGSGFLGKVIVDNVVNFFEGFALKDEKSTDTTVEMLGLVLNVLKFIFFKDSQFFFSSGFETHPHSKLELADNASKSILSMGWYFKADDTIKNNVYLTFGMIPKTSYGGGFLAKIDSPASFEKKFGDHFSLQVIAEGDLEFFYASDYASEIGFDTAAGATNRASVIFKTTPSPDSYSLLKTPEFTVGYGNEHSVELRFNREEIGIIIKTKVSIKFGKGKAKSFPFKFLPESSYDDILPLTLGWTTKRGWFFSDAGTAGANPSQSETKPPASAVARALPPGDSPATEPNTKPNLFFLNVPIKKGFAGITFLNVHVGFGKDGDTTIVETSLDFSFVIGSAFALTVTRLGARFYTTPRDDNKGFFGNDIDVKFKFPTGIGMAIDVSVAKGGGFLSFDDEKGEYFGALELAIDLSLVKFSLKAFGIIQTKIPGASPEEYSLFIVISSDFKPIPLLFGLTLNGVGGLFGHNRTADISLIQSEMRSPYLENILFLKDPIANVSRLITDAGRYFPVAIDKTLIGFSLIIGYGAVFELRMAVIFVKPDKKILVPGYLVLDTPKKSKILHLQINFLAVLDRQEGYFFFRADLVDSKLATFKLTGSLVFAIGWGDSDGLFAITVGGFHPSYKNFPEIKSLPNAFKGLDRLRLSLWEEGKNHLYLELYFAITSNSRQLGAHAYLHVNGPAGFNIDGHLGFDVLWETEPKCYFEADIEARIDFRHNDNVLAGVELNAVFSGPTPKHIEGKAKLKICWFLTVSIPFSKTWGDPAPAVEDEKVDLDELLLAQINDDRNWSAELPDFHHLNVTLKNDPNRSPDEILVQPLGALVFNQRALPLNQEIQRIGSRKAKVVKSLDIGSISSNGNDFTDLVPTEELFAPGQFVDLKEDEKLSRPSFEKMASGKRIGDTGVSNFPYAIY